MVKNFAEKLVSDLQAPKVEIKVKNKDLSVGGVSIGTLKKLDIKQIRKLTKQLR